MKVERTKTIEYANIEQKQTVFSTLSNEKCLENIEDPRPTTEPKEVFDSKSTNKRDRGNSHERSKTAKRSESEKAIGFQWNASKNLRIIYSVMQDIGDEKYMSFGEFMYFYLILNEISGSNTKTTQTKSFAHLLDKLNKSPNKIEANQPHFLWAFMNPDRVKQVKKKIIKDVLKTSLENKSKGRKLLLDNLEEVVRSNESSTETQRSK